MAKKSKKQKHPKEKPKIKVEQPQPKRFRQTIGKVLNRKWISLVLGILVLSLFFYIFKDLPSPTRLKNDESPASTLIFDRSGKLLYKIYAEKNRSPIKIEDLPPYVAQATVASEDKDFYKHKGLAIKGIVRAFYNIVFHQTLQGGSTITQQLVKTTLLTPERTIRRKIREAVLAFAIEILYPKNKILEMYLNQVPYGGTSWGIEAASQTYFGKHAKDLTLGEASLLAGLPASPTRFSPFGAHPELAKSRQERVLARMQEDKYISPDQEQKAKEETLTFASSNIDIQAPHFVLYVKELLVEKYGEKLVEQGGLSVTTTLDLDLQNFTQSTVKEEIEKIEKLKITNGAALVTNPKSGEILAMVGSRDYFDIEHDGNVNVTIMPRQPGSSIKPLNYALAMEKKLITPSTVLNDMPTCFSVPGQKIYCPVNYDGSFHGPVQARFALGNSFNIPAVKVLFLNGLTDFIAKATEMGITTFKDPSNYGLSLTLGGGEVKMVDMATAFGVFAGSGVRQDLFAIKKVEDRDGKTIYEHPEIDGPRVLSLETSFLISHILLDNNARSGAFGTSSYLVVKNHPEVSVKTGTTNDKRDNWTIGFTPSRLVAVWVGNNDNTEMSYVASGVTGASPIWNKIMAESLSAFDKGGKSVQEWPLQPEGIVGKTVCALSGELPPSDNSCPTRFEYFAPDNIPNKTENLKQTVGIDKTTGQVANDKTLPENLEMQEHLVIFDPLGISYCIDCPPPSQSVVINFSSSNLLKKDLQ